MKYVVKLILFLVVPLSVIEAQSKYDYTWVIGKEYNTAKEDGYDDAAEGMILRFDKSPPSIEKYPIPMTMKRSAIMSNPETGELMFYTNGCRIMDRNHDIMENGDSINPGAQFKYYCNEGPSSFYGDNYGSIALPFPGDNNAGKYILFTRLKNLEPIYQPTLFYHVIDMQENQGLGKVLQKNTVILNAHYDFALMSLQACKHANGRDWWIIQWERDKPIYHAILLDKNGPRYHHTDTIGVLGPYGLNQSCFSPDGSKYIWFDHTRGVAMYDFNRENGRLENFKTKIISPYYEYGYGGVSFSPSGRFAYLSARYELFQLDTWEEDFDKAFALIDTISTITHLGIPLNFSNSMLGPDCKIYISTGFAWFYYHVIHNPDEKGKACDLRKLDLQLPWPNSNSAVPNNVHYRMDEEEVCNPRLTSLFPEEWYGRDQVKIYPNPTSDKLRIEGIDGEVQISFYSITGQLMKKLVLSGGQSFDISDLQQGIYILKVSGTGLQTEQTFKIIKL